MSEMNAQLEESLSAATTELEGLRENKVALEESCMHLKSKITTHQSERAVLIAQIEVVSQTMEELMEKNVFLENSLSEANAELESLRRKLKELKESSQALQNHNSILQSEKKTLARQVCLKIIIFQHHNHHPLVPSKLEQAKKIFLVFIKNNLVYLLSITIFISG